MDSLDTQVLAAITRWIQQNQPFVLVTVVSTWGAAPRLPGAWMALGGDGRIYGSVSGGCIETDLVGRWTRGDLMGPLGPANPFLVEYGVTPEESQRYGLPCGGTLTLLVEPFPDQVALTQLASLVAQGQVVQRVVTLGEPGNKVTPVVGGIEQKVSWDGSQLITFHGPRWRLLIIGAGQISHYLASMAQTLDFQIYVCDPRPEYSSNWEDPQISFLSIMPDDAVTQLQPDSHTAVVALTHDPRLDDLALVQALQSPAFYVGALGSKTTSDRRRTRLVDHCSISIGEANRLRSPVGLRIGSRTPPEIAVAILAEIIATQRLGRSGG